MKRRSKSTKPAISARQIENSILMIRGQKVILDVHLAALYGVSTGRLNEQVRRNKARFPKDFAFRLTRQEFKHIVARTSSSGEQPDRSQFAIGSQKHRDPRHPPMAFTEHGAIMAANVMKSTKAVEMSVFVVRAFVKMREQLLATATMERRLAEIERVLLTHDGALRDLYEKIQPLLLPPPPGPPKPKIGFGVRERPVRYAARKKK